MDPILFDALTRSLSGHGSSRRALLRSIGGGIAAAGMLAPPAADAKKKKCKPGFTRCGKKCVDLNTNAKNCGNCKNSCAFEITCAGGTCQCLDLNADCSTNGQCCSGRCSIEVITTCRRLNCSTSGPCAGNEDCCGGFCIGGCCGGGTC